MSVCGLRKEVFVAGPSSDPCPLLIYYMEHSSPALFEKIIFLVLSIVLPSCSTFFTLLLYIICNGSG
jgi:hypothetical protein